MHRWRLGSAVAVGTLASLPLIGLVGSGPVPASTTTTACAKEAPDLVAQPLGHPPYRVTLGERSVEKQGDEATVSGQVLFVRTGEPSQRFTWAMQCS